MIIGAIPGEKKPAISKEPNEATKKNSKITKENQKQGIKRQQGDKVWNDPQLSEFSNNDHRLFIGNLDQNVTDAQLFEAFSQYKSILKAKVIADNSLHKHSNSKGAVNNKGYGFISLGDAEDARRAVREMQMKYVGNKPIKVVKSKWKDKNFSFSKKFTKH
jgi:RNA recognition motif-containing protein